MKNYEVKEFNIPKLEGISEKQIEVHLGLYAGYVKHVNLCRELIANLKGDEKNAYAVTELRRRFAFEFDGMRMHEYYFESLEGGFQNPPENSSLAQALSEKYSSHEDFVKHFTEVGMSRGIGWTVLYYDPIGKTPHITWIGDHEVGTLAGLPIILAMDMWEHAFMVDYTPAEKAKYIDAFLSNVNWNVSEERFKKIG